MMAAGRSLHEVAMLRLVLDGHYRPLLHSHVGADRRATEFQKVNGRRINGPRETAQLLELFVEGMRAVKAADATAPARVGIPRKLGTYSTRSWALVPRHRGQPFHAKVGG
jgi:hypothetical protein